MDICYLGSPIQTRFSNVELHITGNYTHASGVRLVVFFYLDPVRRCSSPSGLPRARLAEFMMKKNAAMDEEGDRNAYGTEDHRIPCVTWSLRADPLRIPPIPQLPDLESTGVSQEERSKETTLIKIAAFDNHLIGLTNKGHVLKFGDLSNEYSFDRTTRWQYVSHPASSLCSS